MIEAASPHGQRLAVLGSPIAHSRSPQLHRAAYEILGLPWEYTAIECQEAQLAGFLHSRDENWRGFSVTMPLKYEAHRRSVWLDPIAQQSGVVNTLLREQPDDARISPRWRGFNTDVGGLAAALREAGLAAGHTVVLGAGATAVSAALAAQTLGATHLTVLARRADAARALATRCAAQGSGATSALVTSWGTFAEVPREECARATLVISTLPGRAAQELTFPSELLRLPLFDVAYDPWPSPLAKRWREAGSEAHPGINMLLQQALLQVRIFVHGDPAIVVPRETEVLAAFRDVAAQMNMPGGGM